MPNDKWILTTAENNVQPNVVYTVTESNANIGGYDRETTLTASPAGTATTTGDTPNTTITLTDSSKTGTVAFTNAYTEKTGSLKLKKAVTVNGAAPTTNADSISNTSFFTLFFLFVGVFVSFKRRLGTKNTDSPMLLQCPGSRPAPRRKWSFPCTAHIIPNHPAKCQIGLAVQQGGVYSFCGEQFTPASNNLFGEPLEILFKRIHASIVPHSTLTVLFLQFFNQFPYFFYSIVN